MKRKLLIATLCASMVLSFAGCKKDGESSDFKLGKYKGIEVEESVATVTDSYLEQYIDYVLQEKATVKEVKKGKVKDGDTVNIDYVGVLDGETEPFEGGSATGQSLTIGSGSFIDGFEDGLIGVKVGKTVDLNLTFPDPYENNSDLAGKKVVFTVTVNAKEVTEVPELTDEFVVENFSDSDVSTVEEFKEFARERLAMSQIINEIWEETVIASKMTISEKELNEKIETLRSQDETNASSMGIDAATYAQYYYGIAEDEYEDYLKTQAELKIKEPYFVKAVAKKEKIEVEDKEYNEQMEYYSSAYSMSADELEEMFESYYDQSLEDLILASKVQEFVAENIKVVPDETTAAVETESTEAESETESTQADETEAETEETEKESTEKE